MAAVRPWTQEGRGFAHLHLIKFNFLTTKEDKRSPRRCESCFGEGIDFVQGQRKAVLPLKENNQEHDMEIKNLKLADLRLNPTNPREVVEEKYKQLIDSILVFPKMLELRPVVHNARREVLGGNMRLRALQDIAQMSLEDIKARLECLEGYRSKPQAERVALLEFWQRWLDSPYAPAASAEGLTDAEQQEFIIKDNLSFGKWDWEALANDWDEEQLGEWGLDVWQPEQEEETPETKEDEFDEDGAIEVRCKKGDIWQLGEHRLMCGDSTDFEQVRMLMEGAKADITFTSPPYNVMASGIANLAKSKKIKGTYAMDGLYGEYSDNLSDEEYGNLLKGTLGNALKVSTDVMYNIGIVKGSKIGILDMLSEYRQNFSDLIVWNKNNCLPLSTPAQRHMLSHICEFIFCFNQKGNRSFTYSQWEAGMQTNRIDTKNNSNNEYSKEHSATFPIELPAYVLQNFSQASVLDLFGGTGTTMIAAEQLERKCYMMELDAHYCDIILARWEQFTGKQAIKIN